MLTISAVPRLAVAAPPGFAEDGARLPPPDLTESPQIVLESWHVDADGPAMLVSACFGGQTGTWLPEADEIALQKLSQITLSTAIRGGLDVSMRPVGDARDGAVRTQTLDGGQGRDGLRAKTLLGFEEGGAVHGCFALCVRGDARCKAAADGARLEGTLVEPPRPNLAMRAVAWAVHHPHEAAAGIVALFVLCGIAAILTRKRPRVSA
jgi:hypothetical protein